jgi:hypothetical protein
MATDIINELLFALGGLSISVIGYFLRGALAEVKQVKEIAYQTKLKVEVLENDYLNKITALNEKIALLHDSISKLNDNIMNLNNRIK